ncbi:MAG TPA: chitinase [Actinomycetota bacterium]
MLIALTVSGPSSASASTPIPNHVFAPYFETWTSDGITSTANASGDKYFTLAFLETLNKTSCTLAWNGSRNQTVADGRYLSDIATLRAQGGDVVPSLGGWSADQGGTEIADSCKDVSSIAAAYEDVIKTYDVSRIDMDVEGRSLGRSAGIDRRNKAIAMVEDWAAAHGRPLQISYTLPTSPAGLDSDGLALLQNAVQNGARVDVVNLMTFDFYDGTTTQMGDAAISAAKGLVAQLKQLYPSQTAAQRWGRVGITIMNGIDDYPKKTEVTTLADAKQILNIATLKGIDTLSMWAIQRDNGGCPGTGGSGDCSGIAQPTWGFSHVFAPFSG